MKKRKFKYEEGGDVYAKPLAKASFKEAFREAREAGDKTFEYMGKKYTTELAGSKKDDTKYGEDKEAVRKAYQESGRLRKPKETPESQYERVKNEKGLETVSPELDVLPVGKIAAAGAATMAALKGAAKLGRNYAAKEAAEETAKKATKDRAAKIAAGKEEAKKTRAKSSGAMEGEAGAGELRYKSGGKVSSASKRADGCAIRGKTRA
jgi:hypothetical protein